MPRSLRRSELGDRRRAARSLPALLVLLLAWPVGASGQGEPIPDVRQDFGTIGLQGLATFAPSLLYRPIDMFAVRPGGDALGMGGAHLASATGAMALGWNPAGLASLERTTVALDGYSLGTSGKVDSYPDSFFIPQSPPLLIALYDVNRKGGFHPNYLAVATPLFERGNLRASGGVAWRRFAEVTVPEETVSELVTPEISGFPVVFSFDRSERGGVDALTPGVAVGLGSKLAVGVALDILDGTMRANNDLRLTVVGAPLRGGGRFKTRYSGTTAEFGLRLTPVEKLHLAARYVPSFKLKAREATFLSTSLNAPATPRVVTTARVADYDLEVPAAFSVGLALRPARKVLFATDIVSQAWSQARADYQERIDSPLLDAAGEDLPLADVTSVSVGSEILLKEFDWARLPVRVGFRTAPRGFRQVSPLDLTPRQVPGTPLAIPVANGTFNGKEVEGNAYSFGASLEMAEVDFHLGIETASYSVEKWFFDLPYDPLANPDGARVTADRTVTTMRLSAAYRF